MRPIATLDEFRLEAERVGLGKLPEADLVFLKNYYDDAVHFVERVREVVVQDDEPATVFKAATPS